VVSVAERMAVLREGVPSAAGGGHQYGQLRYACLVLQSIVTPNVYDLFFIGSGSGEPLQLSTRSAALNRAHKE